MKQLTLILFFAATACAPDAPDETGFAEAAALAASVDEGDVTSSVAELARGHATDQKVSCEGYAPKDGLPACELSHDAAIAFVTETLAGFGYEPHSVVLGEGPPARNVVAERRGETHPEEAVVVAAHLDAFYSGADDDSSGVAVMLEAARIVATRRFARTVRFIGFDLEEYGSVGSTRYVEAGMANDVVLAIIMDCVGYSSNADGSQSGLPGLSVGDVGNFLMVVANGDSIDHARRILALNHANGFVPMKGIAAGESGWFPLTSALTRSDNGPFWLRRLPALMLTDTADLRNPNYHEPADTADTLDGHFMAGAARIGVAAAALFAEPLP